MIEIVYEDQKMLVIFKPAGVLTQSNRSFDVDLTSQVMTYRTKKGEPPYAAVINRLDRPVSGLVLFAKDKQTAATLTKQMQIQEFQKYYDAIICGKPEELQGTFVDYLVKNGKENTSSVTRKETEGSKLAKLEYQLVKTIGSYSHVRIHLLTGRHHQIRVQFSSRNLPILGDGKYGADTANIEQSNQLLKIGRNEIALCACQLTVGKHTYECQPQWLESVLE